MATPTWGKKPMHLSHFMNQPGKAQGTGEDQAMQLSLPEIMNQGASTEYPSAHPTGHAMKGPSLGKMLGQS
jgi:hypothetical protein